MPKSLLNKGLLIALIGIIADQLSKSYILYGLDLGALYANGLAVVSKLPSGSIEITSFFNIVLVWNQGVSFGMFNHGEVSELQPYLLSLLTLTIVGVVTFLLRKAENVYIAAAYGLVIGGALGNLIDRILYGAVVDFLDFHIAGKHWPAFNVADSIILIGVLLLVFEGFFVKDSNHEKS